MNKKQKIIAEMEEAVVLYKAGGQKWTPEEEEFIMEYYGRVPYSLLISKIKELFGHNRSLGTIRSRVSMLKTGEAK